MVRELKDSGIEWIGMIPADWALYPARYAFSEIRTKNIEGTITNALKFYNGTIIQKTNFDAESDDYVADTITNYTIVNPDTIMINGLNLNYDLKSLRVGLVKEKGVITSAYLALWPDHDRIFPEYATYLFKGYETKMAFHNMGAGIRKTLGFKEFKHQPVLIPPMEEQKRIADYLDTECSRIDSVIEQTRSSIEEYKKLKQAVITQAVTKGIRPGRKMKDSGVEWIGEIPSKWSFTKTLNCLSMPITDGPHTTPELFDNGVAFISAEAVSCGNGKIDFSHMRGYISREFYEECCKKYIPKIDDIYMIKSGATTGKVSIVDTLEPTFTIWSPLAVFRCNAEIMNPRFLFYTLQSDGFQKQVELGWTYGTQQNIGMRTLEQLKICIPPLDEQVEIADYVERKAVEIDDLIGKKERLLSELETYKKSLIYEYVTGKKEV